MFRKLKMLKLWQKVLLVAITVGIALGIYGIYNWADDGSSIEASVEDTLVAVQYGNLTSSIYSSGSLVYSTSEQLTFDSAGTVEAVYVEKDDTVEQGEVLARLDSESIESLEEAVARARINLRDAEEALENAQNPYTESDIADAEAAVERAEQELLDAQERGVIQIANAEYKVYKAYENYCDVLKQYMIGEVGFEEKEAAKRDWELAQLDLAMAKPNVDKDVSQAEDELETAEETLEEMLDGADPLEVALKQSELDSARAALDDALEQLELAEEGYPVVAPFDGVVAKVNVDPGEEVNANTVVIEFVDSSAFEVSAIVDEIDVAQLRLGQEATVTLDAISDIELSGKVSSISAFAQSQSGVVSYPITISLATPEGVQLLEGMSATATIEIELASNALLVPSQAIIGGTGSRAVVRVMVNEQPEPRMITMGATDGVQTEVITGLEEGEVVLVEGATAGTSFEGFLEGFFPEGFRPPEGFTPPEGFFPGGDGGPIIINRY